MFRLRLLFVALSCLIAASSDSHGQIFQEDSEPTRVILEESRQAAELLAKFEKALEVEEFQAAATAAIELSALGAEKLLPEILQGARRGLRERILSLSPRNRRCLNEAMAPEAEAALSRAAQAGRRSAALLEVYLSYPGSQAGRQALKLLWAELLEQGRLRMTAEIIELYCSDPVLSPEDRGRALTLLAACGSMLGRAELVDRAEALMPDLPEGYAFDWSGERLSPSAAIKRMRDRLRPQAGISTVGGLTSGGEPEKVEFPSSGGAAVADKRSSGGLHGLSEVVEESRASLLRMAPEQAGQQPVTAITSGNRLFSIVGQRVAAVAMPGGRQLWSRELPLIAPQQPHTRMFLRSLRGRKLFVGSEQWLVSSAGRLVVLCSEQARSQLAVLDESDGRTIWQWPGEMHEPAAEMGGAEEGEAGGADASGGVKDVAGGVGGAGGGEVRVWSEIDRDGLYPIGVPLVYGGRIFMVAVNQLPGMQAAPIDAYLVCLDLSEGELLWSCFLGSDLPSSDLGGLSITRAAAVTDGRHIYVTSGLHSLAAVEMATGDVVWAKRFVPGANRVMIMNANVNVRPMPMLAGDRLIVSSGRNGQLWAVNKSDGRALWQVDEASPLVLGTFNDCVVLGDIGYDGIALRRISDGALKKALNIKSVPWGRPLMAGGKLLAPTDKGLLSLDLENEDQQVLIALEPAAAQPVAVVPIEGGLAFVAGESIHEYVDMELVAARYEAGRRANPDDWRLRLEFAALRCRQGRWAEAEALLDEASQAAGDERGANREQQDAVLRQRVWLYAAWAAKLVEQADEAGGLAKWQAALACTAESDDLRLHVLLNIGRLARKLGLTDEAAAAYQEVIRLSGSRNLLFAADEDGVRRSPTVLAMMALAEMRREDAEKALPPGAGSASAGGWGATAWPAGAADRLPVGDLVNALQTHLVADLRWASGGKFVADDQDFPVSAVWVRRDGLAAFGPRGEILWMSSSDTEKEKFDAWLLKDRIVEQRGRDYIIRDRCSGREVGRRQMAAAVAAGDNGVGGRVVRVRRVIRIENGVVVEDSETINGVDVRAGVTAEPMAIADGLLLPLRKSAKLSELVLLSSEDCRPKWTVEIENLRQVVRFGRDLLLLNSLPGQMTRVEMVSGEDGKWQHLWLVSPLSETLVSDERLILTYPAEKLVTEIDIRGKDGGKPEIIYQGKLRPGCVTPVAGNSQCAVWHGPEGLICLDNRGERKWQLAGVKRSAARADRQGGAVPWVELDGNLLTLAAADALYAVDIEKGEVVWKHQREVEPGQQPGLVRVGEVIVAWTNGAAEAELKFFDCRSGKLLRRLFLGASRAEVTVRPISGGLLVTNGRYVMTVVLPSF